MTNFYKFLAPFLGLGADARDFTFPQVSLRALIVFLSLLVMMRLSSKRSLARKTAFDAALLVILASVLSRAVNGNGGFFTTIGGCFVFVFLHRLLGVLAYQWHFVGILIKGEPNILVRDGVPDRWAMARNQISNRELEEDLRLDAKTDDLSKIKIARVERSGDISFIKKQG